MINGSFVFGFDHDDAQVFDRTVQFGIDARLEYRHVYRADPLPGDDALQAS